jgi:hypothetical protein
MLKKRFRMNGLKKMALEENEQYQIGEFTPFSTRR